MRVELTIPLPPKGCAQNTRMHWRVRHKADQISRDEAFGAALEAYMTHGAFSGPVRVHHTWYMARNAAEGARGVPRRYRPLDEGNAIGALKAAIDGVVASGLIRADDHKSLKWGDGVLLRSAKDHQGRSCVVLVFEEVE